MCAPELQKRGRGCGVRRGRCLVVWAARGDHRDARRGRRVVRSECLISQTRFHRPPSPQQPVAQRPRAAAHPRLLRDDVRRRCAHQRWLNRRPGEGSARSRSVGERLPADGNGHVARRLHARVRYDRLLGPHARASRWRRRHAAGPRRTPPGTAPRAAHFLHRMRRRGSACRRSHPVILCAKGSRRPRR